MARRKITGPVNPTAKGERPGAFVGSKGGMRPLGPAGSTGRPPPALRREGLPGGSNSKAGSQSGPTGHGARPAEVQPSRGWEDYSSIRKGGRRNV
jgi:hypothetical protein